MKTVKYCSDSFEAYLTKGKLESEGIEAAIINEHVNTVLPYMSAVPSFSVQVVVDDPEYDRAIAVLEEHRQEELACPECGSPRVKTVFTTGAFRRILLFLWGNAFGSGLPGGAIRNVRSRFVCRDCGKEFVRE